MIGFEYYYGNLIFSYVEDYFNLIGIGYVLVLSFDKYFNIMVCMQFLLDFGDKCVFCFNDNLINNVSEKYFVVQEYYGLLFLGGEVSYKKLVSLVG